MALELDKAKKQAELLFGVLHRFYNKGLLVKNFLLKVLTENHVEDARFVLESLIETHICDNTQDSIAVIQEPSTIKLVDIIYFAQSKKQRAILEAIEFLQDEGYEVVKHS